MRFVHLDGVRMPQLVGREPTPDSRVEREMAQLDPRGAIRPSPAAGRAVDHAEQCPDGQLGAVGCPGLDRGPCPGVDADLASAVVLAVLCRVTRYADSVLLEANLPSSARYQAVSRSA